MIVIATSITLNHWGWVLPFALLSALIRLMMPFRPGLKFVQMRRTPEAAYLTLTAWEDAPTMLSFRNHGLHAMAMSITPLLLKEAKTARWRSDKLPDSPEALWQQALEKLADAPPYSPKTHGKSSS